MRVDFADGQLAAEALTHDGGAGLRDVDLEGGGGGDGADVLRDNRGFLWSANALVSAYSEKDQVTLIANGQNINDSNAVLVYIDDDGEATASTGQGLSTAGQLGLNANTSRIKDVETTVGANYKYTDTDSGTRSSRTTYQEDGNLHSTEDNTGKAYNQSVSANMEFQKEKGKTWFHIRPYFSYNRSHSTRLSASETRREAEFLNRSESSTQSQNSSRDVDLDGDVTFREIGGKENRTLHVDFGGSYSGRGGESSELSVFTADSGSDRRAMNYSSRGSSHHVHGGLEYTEPLGDKWTLEASASGVSTMGPNNGQADRTGALKTSPALKIINADVSITNMFFQMYGWDITNSHFVYDGSAGSAGVFGRGGNTPLNFYYGWGRTSTW